MWPNTFVLRAGLLLFGGPRDGQVSAAGRGDGREGVSGEVEVQVGRAAGSEFGLCVLRGQGYFYSGDHDVAK